MFATKPELAGELLARAHEGGIRAAFVVGDVVYGGRQLRRAIRGPCRASGSRPDAARPGGRLRRTARHHRRQGNPMADSASRAITRLQRRHSRRKARRRG